MWSERKSRYAGFEGWPHNNGRHVTEVDVLPLPEIIFPSRRSPHSCMSGLLHFLEAFRSLFSRSLPMRYNTPVQIISLQSGSNGIEQNLLKAKILAILLSQLLVKFPLAGSWTCHFDKLRILAKFAYWGWNMGHVSWHLKGSIECHKKKGWWSILANINQISVRGGCRNNRFLLQGVS